MYNHLKNETSPYLLQHAQNPVNWYPWGKEAFERAGAEDKPIFLSIGYSTCHWCHVMAHESFENAEIAGLLNRYFISVKVDKEERPDIDSVFMSVCQAFTGSGGWPASIFMTSGQKPFFAGTYFPPTAMKGMVGFRELLGFIAEKWRSDRASLIDTAEGMIRHLKDGAHKSAEPSYGLIQRAADIFKKSFDSRFGGFGNAPKFPCPHNLIFLMDFYEKTGDEQALRMAEITLKKMFYGGLFDHIGGGFCRYSTDRRFLVPHFEKMLYDNALLISAYSRAYILTKDVFYKNAAQRTAEYVLREMTSPEGGFYSAQDADSGGEEGRYYVFSPNEIKTLLKERAGVAFNRYFDITEQGNFEGKSIPNLLGHEHADESMDALIAEVYEYRKKRCSLHLDDKQLTAWNSLMITGMCALFYAAHEDRYLEAAKRAESFISQKLSENGTLFVSYREQKRGEKGFLDDYACYTAALLSLYSVTLEEKYLKKAELFCKKAEESFFDHENGGFFLYGREHEQLLLKPKDTFDGAVPSGNSIMTFVLARLHLLTGDGDYEKILAKQLAFMSAEAEGYPAGYSAFLTALSEYINPPARVTVVLGDKKDAAGLPLRLPYGSAVRVIKEETLQYPLKNGRTTYYVCARGSCMPPVNDISGLL